jgi:hypothetical protein
VLDPGAAAAAAGGWDVKLALRPPPCLPTTPTKQLLGAQDLEARYSREGLSRSSYNLQNISTSDVTQGRPSSSHFISGIIANCVVVREILLVSSDTIHQQQGLRV